MGYRITAIIIALAAITGCRDYKAEAESKRRFEAESAAKQAIEKEAHADQYVWYEVQVGKFDGQCIAIGRSARREADSYSYASLRSAKKEGTGIYVLAYDVPGPFYHRTYTTSHSLCEAIIANNINK